MANNRFNTQIATIKESQTGSGQKPLPRGSKSVAMPERTANWPGLPGKAGPDRSAGVPQEKIYPLARGLAGGKEVADGDE